MKKAKIALATLAACLMLAPTTALAAETEYEEGWQEGQGGLWYQFEDGSYAQDDIYYAEDKSGAVDEDGNPERAYYIFDANGYLVTGWYEMDGFWYYADPSTAELVKGWQYIGGSWFYFDYQSKDYNGGYGFEMIADRTYYIDETPDDDKYETTPYHFGADGAMTTGWYYNPSATDPVGKNYGAWYYSDNSGVVQTGWQYMGGCWYYFDDYSGAMYSDGYSWIYDEETDESTKYYFTAGGSMVNGWYNYDPYSTYGNWVYCNADGTVYDGWLSSGGKWYWIEEGDMLESRYIYTYEDEDGNVLQGTSTWIPGYYDEDDNYVSGYYAEELAKYYVGRDGAMVDNGWYYYETKDATGYYSNGWIYAWVGGAIEKGWVASGATWYYVDSDGDMVRDGKYFTGDYDNAPAEPELEYPEWDDFTGDDASMSSEEYSKLTDARAKYYAAWNAYEVDYYKWQLANYYVFDGNGAMVTGWYGSTSTWGTDWYYTNPDGTVYDGWLFDGGHWYYIKAGVMLRNQYTPDGYWVDNSGVWQ